MIQHLKARTQFMALSGVNPTPFVATIVANIDGALLGQTSARQTTVAAEQLESAVARSRI